jgi:23S rRNA pseudouridine1911/1915/1917 synthase
MPDEPFEDFVDAAYERTRLDVYLADLVEDATRSYLKILIKDGCVTVNGGVCKRPGRPMSEGDKVSVEFPPPPTTGLSPEDIPLEIVYEDADVVVVDKPSGLVVHPAPGHDSGTLVNALLHHCPDFRRDAGDPERPGIVHRLDRHTSGLLVVAKNPKALAFLAQQAREHTFERRYLALVRGEFPDNNGRIVAAVGRSTVDRKKMSVTGVRGRDAATRFEVLERFGAASFLGLQLETGRTHQIRVHLRFTGHPVLGDPVYGIESFDGWDVPDGLKDSLNALDGQALHAERLGFVHPTTGETLRFTAPPPPDFQNALDALRTWAGKKPS